MKITLEIDSVDVNDAAKVGLAIAELLEAQMSKWATFAVPNVPEKQPSETGKKLMEAIQPIARVSRKKPEQDLEQAVRWGYDLDDPVVTSLDEEPGGVPQVVDKSEPRKSSTPGPMFRFLSDFGFQPGQVLCHKNMPAECTVVNERQVSYNGELMGLSKASRELAGLKQKGYASNNPLRFWTVPGRDETLYHRQQRMKKAGTWGSFIREEVSEPKA